MPKDIIILKAFKEEPENLKPITDFKSEIEKNGYKYDKDLEESFIDQMKRQGRIDLMWASFKIGTIEDIHKQIDILNQELEHNKYSQVESTEKIWENQDNIVEEIEKLMELLRVQEGKG